MAEGSHSNGSRFMKLNDTVKGQWVNCKVLVTYDSAADSYCAKYYVDGTLIADGYGKAESTKLRSNTALANGGEGYKFMPYIVGNSTDSNDRIRIDNIILREYGYATMQEDQQIAVGQTEVTVPFANAAFKSDETAPAAVKNAAAIYGSDFSASDITAVRYAADDTFMVNGTEAEVTLVETAADGIKLSVPALGKGEKLKLTVQNCGDFSGAALANRTTVLYNDTADGFLGIELADFDGESKTVGENNTIPAAIKTMKLLKKDTTAALTLTKDGAETADYTATAASGAYTFDFSAKTLTPNTAYTLKSGEDTIAVFTTDAGMLDFGTPTNADGKARIEVRNITNASQEVYLIYAIYAEDESLIRLDYKTETVAAGAVQTMTTDNALTDSEAKTAKVFVWDGFLDINPLAASTPFTLK